MGQAKVHALMHSAKQKSKRTKTGEAWEWGYYILTQKYNTESEEQKRGRPGTKVAKLGLDFLHQNKPTFHLKC